MRVVSIVGARPQFVKLAPVSRAMSAYGAAQNIEIEDIIIHTGQHYDHGLSEVFFDELRIPPPTVNLDIGSASHGAQTGRMLEGIERAIQKYHPNVTVIYGDTNSTVAGALAASKLNVPVAHIEAGLRSFNREMPEEINRIAADHISDLLLAPTQTAVRNLANEGLEDRCVRTGDVMFDAALYNAELAALRSTVLADLDVQVHGFAVATIHRASNTDPDVLEGILTVLNEIADDVMDIVFPIHPRTASLIRNQLSKWQPSEKLRIIDPLGYLDMLKLLDSAKIAITDSGGLQKEAYFLRTPCITLRDETEWPETVAGGGNVLAGVDPSKIRAAVDHWNEVNSSTRSDGRMEFGNGQAASLIVQELVRYA